MFIFRGEVKINNDVVIIDIDEKSLDKIGQWPWGRDKVSELLEKLTNAGVGAIGMDILFAEEDKSSPHYILKDYNITNIYIRNNDEIFASTISNTPTILAYQFQIDGEEYLKQGEINIPAIVIEKNKQSDDEYILNAKGVILNIPAVQNNAYSSGFFNNIPDESGMIRSVPLIIKYDDQMYPSLDLELIRASLGINKIVINYIENGIESISIGDFFIPTDRYGRLIVNFRGPSKTFKYISAYDILNNDFNKKDLDGKIVLIGTTAAGLKDLRAIPFDNIYPGVEVHANVIDNILQGDFLTQPLFVDNINILMIFIVTILTIMLVTYSPFWVNPFVMFFMGIVTIYYVYIMLFEYKVVLDLFIPLFAIFISTIIATFMDYVFEIKKERRIKEKFATKVSEDVMKNLLDDESGAGFHSIQREVSVFFSDIRSFTNISESASDAKNLIEFLNIYMDPMTDIIIKQKGTIDKYIGDAIMAYWNAPTKVNNHATLAVNCALEQLHHLRDLNKKIKKDKRFKNIVMMMESNNAEPIDIGIGINTGVAIIGEMGSSKRSDYTVIGDPINLGARLESLCKYYNSKLNISDFTKVQLEDKYIFRFLDKVRVKGKSEPVKIWQIHDFKNNKFYKNLYDISYNEIEKELDTYHNAINLYQEKYFKEALEIFKDIDSWKNKTNQNIYEIYIKRCEHYIEFPPEKFDGIFEHTTKG
jgi:adenylate cyclase